MARLTVLFSLATYLVGMTAQMTCARRRLHLVNVCNTWAAQIVAFHMGDLWSSQVVARMSQNGPVILLAPEYDYGLRWVGAFPLHQIGTIARRF